MDKLSTAVKFKEKILISWSQYDVYNLKEKDWSKMKFRSFLNFTKKKKKKKKKLKK